MDFVSVKVKKTKDPKLYTLTLETDEEITVNGETENFTVNLLWNRNTSYKTLKTDVEERYNTFQNNDEEETLAAEDILEGLNAV